MTAIARNITVYCSLFLYAVLSLQAHAEVPPSQQAAKEQLLEAMELTGIASIIKQTTPILNSTMRDFGANQNQTLRESLKAHVTNEAITEKVIHYLLANYDANRIQQVIEVFRSPLVQRMSDRERQVSKPDELKNMRSYHQKIKDRPPRAIRISLVEALDEAAKTTEFSTAIKYEVAKTVYAAQQKIDELDKPLTEQSLDELLILTQNQLQTQAQSQVKTYFLYANRYVANTHIESYIEEYLAQDVQWFLDLCVEGMGNAFRETRQVVYARIAS